MWRARPTGAHRLRDVGEPLGVDRLALGGQRLGVEANRLNHHPVAGDQKPNGADLPGPQGTFAGREATGGAV
jgi:hypothetical protein